MRIAPVSGDLLVKVVLLAVAGGVVWYASRRAVSAVQGAVGQASDAVWAPVQDFGRWANSTWNDATDSAGRATDYVLGPVRDAGTWIGQVVPDYGAPPNPTAPIAPWWLGGGSITEPPYTSGGGGQFNGHGATGSW